MKIEGDEQGHITLNLILMLRKYRNWGILILIKVLKIKIFRLDNARKSCRHFKFMGYIMNYQTTSI